MAEIHPDARGLLDLVTDDLVERLQEKLVGLYLTGSLTTGAYEPNLSDIDIIGVLEKPLTEEELEGLKRWGERLTAVVPLAKQLDIALIELDKVKTADGSRSRGGIEFWKGKVEWSEMSLGDNPIVWDNLLQDGIVLFGAPPGEIIESVPEQHVRAATKMELDDLIRTIDKHFGNDMKFRYYLTSTLCRMTCRLKIGKNVSKQRAMDWYVNQNDTHSKLIAAAQEYVLGNEEKIKKTERQEYLDFIKETESLCFEGSGPI